MDNSIINIAHHASGPAVTTEAAEPLTGYASACEPVRVVWTHTLPEPNASTRVLSKCGIRRIGEAIDAEDGWVWRWGKHDHAAG